MPDGPYSIVRIGDVTEVTLLDWPDDTVYWQWYVRRLVGRLHAGPD